MNIENIIKEHKKYSNCIEKYNSLCKRYKKIRVYYNKYKNIFNYTADLSDIKNRSYCIHPDEYNYSLVVDFSFRDKETRINLKHYTDLAILEFFEPDIYSMILHDYVSIANSLRNKNKFIKDVENLILYQIDKRSTLRDIKLKLVLSDDAKKQDRINNLVENLIFI
jgi:hypothetical protein